MFKWIGNFLSNSATRTITFVCIIVGVFVGYIAMQLIIECLNGTMGKVSKCVIIAVIVIALAVVGYFGISYAVNLSNKISNVLT